MSSTKQKNLRYPKTLLLLVVGIVLAGSVGLFGGHTSAGQLVDDGSNLRGGGGNLQAPAAPTGTTRVHPPSRAQITASKAKRAQQNDNAVTATIPLAPPVTAPATPTQPATNPPPVITPSVATTPKLAPDPEGDIRIVTYYDDPAIDKSNDGHDRRLGGVKVSISREGGQETCSTHTKTPNHGTTYTKNIVKGKPFIHHPKGLIHFNNCNAAPATASLACGVAADGTVQKGSIYTVTVQERVGTGKIITHYVPREASQTICLKDNEHHLVSFVLDKR